MTSASEAYERYYNVACIGCGYPECKDTGIWGVHPPGCTCTWVSAEDHAALETGEVPPDESHPLIHKMECPACPVRFAYLPGDDPRSPSRRFWELIAPAAIPPRPATVAWADARYLDGQADALRAAADIEAFERQLVPPEAV
jgi:hypothetical protein